MADLLVKHLKLKAEDHSALRSLYSQWDFDEKLIPKALQTVGSLFPHYSRHDESHSKQILVNIERLLGDNISLLTATDTWLLLESAYWHDIGMVVPQADMQDAIDDPEFQEFVESICAQQNHELHSFACAFKLKADPALIFEYSTPLEMVSKFREFMAEWFRRKHPARAEQIVRAPMSTVGISSPRTELIPARLFKLLGRICQIHGAPFGDLLAENGLPFREAGLAQEDCHPRFVACLLRMGDLLDLDDNRFCPVMQRIAGDDRSSVSKAHEDKHAGMRHLRIDQERIEVVAECETIDGYLEAFRWFDWLKQEVQDQRANWRDIVPNRELGLLPMLGPISVRLGGNLQILKAGERPAFSVDTGKAIELLQGNNLYDSRFVCVRELLQNAVDATLLRIWLTNRNNTKSWETPDDAEMRALFKSAQISVELVESTLKKDTTSEKSVWTLTIRDTGTGISRNDLEHMLRIGGSQRNTERQREIIKMPEWMKPSGTFGIGLQSAFMLCEELSLQTKSIFTNEIFDITMHSPTGPKEGLVVLRKLNDDISTSHGTTVKLTFELDAFAKSWYISGLNDASIASRLVKALDPVLDENFPYEAALLADQVAAFGQHSLIPISGALTTLDGRFNIDGENPVQDDDTDRKMWRFIKTEQTEVRFWYEPNIGTHPAHSIHTFYRGQEFETKNIYLPNVRIEIDLMSGKAGSWLNFNRDKASSSAHEMLQKTALACLQYAVKEDLQIPENCPLLTDDTGEKRATYSLFLKGMALEFGGDWIDLSNRLDDAWLDHVANNDGKKIRSFFEQPDWTLGAKYSEQDSPLPGCDLIVSESRYELTLSIILSEWVKITGNTIQAVGPEHICGPSPVYNAPTTTAEKLQRLQEEHKHLRIRYRLRNEPQEPWSKNALATELSLAMRRSHGNRRYILCVDGSFELLALRNDTKLTAQKLFPMLAFSGNCVLLPFLFLDEPKPGGVHIETTSDQIDALCRWTQPRLSNQAKTDDIRRSYYELAKFIDYEIMKPTIFWERWKRARGLPDESTQD
ncbi:MULTISPECIES: ATP-binding protein [unclassified Pseudomonas]|uniref:HD domain-containing protein n=1 Tax=unclassified Pseudomonas TaxID=196821 RepID=UPI001CBDD523|nr:MULTISPECIES: ATP-binding protein [unclassified Pseudomonas]